MAHSASDVPATVLAMLKVDLGLMALTADQTSYFSSMLAAGWDRLEAMGMTLSPTASPDDAMLIVTYAAWTLRKRDTAEGMSPMLRAAIHDRQVREVTADDDL